MRTSLLILVICLLIAGTAAFAAGPGSAYSPEMMPVNMIVETTRGNGPIAFLDMYFKDAGSIQSILVEQSTVADSGFRPIKRVWGVDIVHAETNRFIVMDTQVVEVDNPTYYRFTLCKHDGSCELFYAVLEPAPY